MLSNIKIGPKLIGGFLVVALIGAVIGIIGLNNINIIGKNKLPAIQALVEMGKEQNALQYAIRGTMLQRYWDNLKLIEDQFAAYDDADKNIEKCINIYERLPKSKEEETEWQRFKALVNEWGNTSDAIINNAKEKYKLVQSGIPMNNPKITALENELYDVLAPVARKAFGTARESMDKLIEMNGNATTATIRASGIIMPVTIIIGVVLAILLGLFLTMSTTGPLTRCVNTVKDIAQGKLNTKLSMVRRDEIGILAGAMDSLLDIIKSMVQDVNLLAKAGVEGRLQARADASKHAGEFRTIVQGVNNTFDSLVGFLDSMPAPAMIVDKEFSIQYMNKTGASIGGKDQKQLVGTKCYDFFKTGDCRTDKCACGRAIMSGQISASETDAHPNGLNLDISYTAVPVKDEKGTVIGAFEVVTDLTAIKKAQRRADKISKFQGEEVQKVTNCLSRLSKGDLGFVVQVGTGDEDTKDAREVFTTIAGGLNECRSAVEKLVADVNLLAEAGVEGRLQTRADASKHNGDFKKIVDGVNITLDTVIIPINEAQAVLEKVAARDMTARVKGDYKGDLAKIKNAINTAVDNLDTALTQVAEATEQVSSGSQQISAGSQNLAQGSNEQASSLEEVSSSLEEMASMTKQNAENANQANNLAGEANANAAQGAEAMKRMSGSINKIKESSDQTAKIVKTIDEIAMQTNLLALNAAVEAARAGEAGRGFAVVAEEVRNLAQRSAEAAKNTANMIEESVKNAEEGVNISTEVSKSFDAIAGSAKKVNDLIAEIAAASQEQSQGIDQVNTAVAQMDKVTQQNAANSEESASAAEEMSSQAEELQSMIAQFMLSQASVQKKNAPVTHAEVKQSAPVHKNGNGKKHLKTPELAMSNKKNHADQLIPMDDEVLKQF